MDYNFPTPSHHSLTKAPSGRSFGSTSNNKSRMNKKLLAILCLTQIALASPMIAALIISDPIEDDGTWTLDTTVFQYHPAAYGLTPRAGTVMMHMNNNCTCYSGTNSIIYTNTVISGSYIVSLDVGHWNNADLSTVGPIGLTVGGKLLTAGSSSTPRPALGQFETWRFAYSFTPGNTNIGNRVGFQISVPYTGLSRNIAFDNLRIDYYLPNVVLPSIYHAAELCWDTQTNKTYQLQWAPTLDDTNWNNMGPSLQGTGSNHCVLDSTRYQQKRFYRVLTVP